MPRKRRKGRRRYGWALLIPADDPRLQRLSGAARSGLLYLRELAEDAAERRLLALEGAREAPLTPADLARRDWLSVVEVNRCIRQARLELFGKDLSDAAIYYRLRRDRERGQPASRPCAEEGCARPLPRQATARRRYCAFHGASHARVARHRRRRAGG